MTDIKQFYTLILAAGTGQRYHAGDAKKSLPKQYETLNGLPILRHAILNFLSHNNFKELHVIINKEHQDLYRDAVQGLDLPPPILGGSTRKQSCYNGLTAIPNIQVNDPILIHDAARPFLCHRDIDNLLTALQQYHSVTLGKPIPETMRRADENGLLYDHIDRTACWALQTPQGFRYGALLNAHETHKDNDAFTDDCGVMEAVGHPTKVIKRLSPNIKITWPEDLKEAESIMKQKTKTHIGQGFDVHAFGNDSVKSIRLGGIDVPYHRNLTAHSDGDVALHALTDALLGAIGEGDIGLHFPPSDPQWKGQDSAFFLQEAHKILQQRRATISNIDLTLICEEPKLTPVRESMRAAIAALLGLSARQVNVKATTTEQLGFTGRKEGIACQAIVSVNCPCDENAE